jgi:phenol hydroxylase P0 protein
MTPIILPEPSAAAAAPLDTTRRYVRARGERRGLVEFDFAIGEPELFVELMLSPEAFTEFCATNHAVVLDAEAASAVPEHDWRLSDVGAAQHD